MQAAGPFGSPIRFTINDSAADSIACRIINTHTGISFNQQKPGLQAETGALGEVYAEENRCYSLKIATSSPIQQERLTVVSNIRKQLSKCNRTNMCRLHHKNINLRGGKKKTFFFLQWSNSSLLIKDFHYSRHCESPV